MIHEKIKKVDQNKKYGLTYMKEKKINQNVVQSASSLKKHVSLPF